MGLAVCAVPIFSQLFMQGAFGYGDVQQTARALVAYAPGLLFVGISRVIVPTFYALQDTKTPVRVSFWTLLANVGFGVLLMGPFKHVGLAAALTLSSVLNAMLLLWLLRRKLGSLALDGVAGVVVKAMLASAAMAAVVHWCLSFGVWRQGVSFNNLSLLVGAISAGVVVYLVSCFVLKVDEVSELMQLVRRKVRRSGN